MELEESRDEVLEQGVDESLAIMSSAIENLQVEMADLRDLFVRRLFEDRQKAELIRDLGNKADYAFIEPFLYDLILLLDRIEKVDDEFVRSVRDELYDIVHRRGVERIRVTQQFDPNLNRVVKVIDGEPGTNTVVVGVVRNGYTFANRVVRPAEVLVARGRAHHAQEG